MTEREKEIVTENYDLIYAYCHKNKLPLDEWEDVLALEFCESIGKWDEDKGTLGTFAYLRFRHVVERKRRDANCKKRGREYFTKSLNEFVPGCEKEIELIETIPDNQNPISAAEARIQIDWMREFLENLLTIKEMQTVHLFLDGREQSDIAETLGVSKQYVNHNINIAKEILRANF